MEYKKVLKCISKMSFEELKKIKYEIDSLFINSWSEEYVKNIKVCKELVEKEKWEKLEKVFDENFFVAECVLDATDTPSPPYYIISKFNTALMDVPLHHMDSFSREEIAEIIDIEYHRQYDFL